MWDDIVSFKELVRTVDVELKYLEIFETAGEEVVKEGAQSWRRLGAVFVVWFNLGIGQEHWFYVFVEGRIVVMQIGPRG